MIHTLTLNPTLDLTYLVDEFRHEDTTRAHTVYRAPGGKGINVSRVVTRLGHPTVALGFIAGGTGMEVARRLEDEGVNTWFTPLESGETRANPIVQDAHGQHLRVSAPGPEADERAVLSLRDNIFSLRAPNFLLVSGSRLRGVPEDFYAGLIKEARAAGVAVAVDADGAELQRGITAGASLVKPNRFELERLVGRELQGVTAMLGACQEVIAMGVEIVAASMGGDGALLVTKDAAFHGVPPSVQLGGAVGAGDSFLAGLLVKLAEGESPLEALRFAVACGTATASVPGSQLCTLPEIHALLPRVVVKAL
jgi:6-phosphofructokinase 2